jgi:hypothetical protein
LLVGVALWLFTGLLTGCEAPDASSSSIASDTVDSTDIKERYGVGYCGLLFVEEVDGAMTVTINGFPVRRLSMGRWWRDTLCPRVETGLIGDSNDLSVRIEPFTNARGSQLHIGDVLLDVHARRMGQGPMLPPRSLARRNKQQVDSLYRNWANALLPVWREYVERQNADLEANPDRPPWALDSMRAYVRRNPLVISMRFTNRYGPDFSGLFEEAPVIEGTPADTARLTRYALHLRDLMAQRDTAALYEEFFVAFEDSYIASAPKPTPEGRRDHLASNREHIVLSGLTDELNFDASDVGVRKWAGGRIWELNRGVGSPLLRNLPVYVAEVNGSLKVVRI